MPQKIGRAHLGAGILPEITIIRFLNVELDIDVEIKVLWFLWLDGGDLTSIKPHQTHSLPHIESGGAMHKSEIGHFGEEPTPVPSQLIDVISQTKEQQERRQ